MMLLTFITVTLIFVVTLLFYNRNDTDKLLSMTVTVLVALSYIYNIYVAVRYSNIDLLLATLTNVTILIVTLIIIASRVKRGN